MKLCVFTYAPAGLGHLRVTDALVDTRPDDCKYVMFGSDDSFIRKLHRFTSVNPLAKHIFERSQYGLFEDIFTFVYRGLLVLDSAGIKNRLKEVISQNKDVDEVYVIASHFGMAHQIGAIKQDLEKDLGKVIHLIVQVTDDTSQHMWVVRGAGLTMVSSEHIKKEFEKYALSEKMSFSGHVCPYPLSPVLSKKLPSYEKSRHEVMCGECKDKINICIPVSGAAVGLQFLSSLIKKMLASNSRVKFWVIAKKSAYTEVFFRLFENNSRVNLVWGRNDNEVVGLYEKIYKENVIHLEITKPSEQTFKALLTPDMRGGSILLFTEPVGRQEYDNLDFLRRNGLLLEDGSESRCFRLPLSYVKASKFIESGIKSGLFSRSCKDMPWLEGLNKDEVDSDGSSRFWKVVKNSFE